MNIKFDFYFLFKSSLLSTFDVQVVVKIFLKLLDLKMKTPSVPAKLVLSTTTQQGLPVSQIMRTFFSYCKFF